MGLYCLRALRGLCGFCVRERLGGFMACSVFAPVFVLLPISFCLPFHLFTCFLSFALSALFWLSFACPLVLFVLVSLWSFLLFPFPYRTIRKKKGRAVLVRPLLTYCVLV